jgi:hypothetical protein
MLIHPIYSLYTPYSLSLLSWISYTPPYSIGFYILPIEYNQVESDLQARGKTFFN